MALYAIHPPTCGYLAGSSASPYFLTPHATLQTKSAVPFTYTCTQAQIVRQKIELALPANSKYSALPINPSIWSRDYSISLRNRHQQNRLFRAVDAVITDKTRTGPIFVIT